MSIETAARELAEAMQPKTGPAPYDTQAMVLRVEGDTLWVHIPGGAEETPVQRTINASPGDTIQIRVGGGSAWAVGNATAPPTDDTVATVAAAKATEAAETANGVKASLEVQEGQIRAAVETADEANQAASEAIQKLDSITFRVIGSDGTVTEIEINDQGQINLLGTVLAQKIMAEDLVATNSFQVNNGVWNLTQGTTGMELASADGNTSMSVVDGDLTIAMIQSDGTDSMVKVQNDANNDPRVTIHATRQRGSSLRPVVNMASIAVTPDRIYMTGGVNADTLTVDTLTVNEYDVGDTLDTLTGQITYQSGVSLKSLAPGIHIVANATDTPPYTPWTSWVCIVAGSSSGQTTKIIARPLSVETGTWEIHRVSGTWSDWLETGRTYPLTGNLSTATPIRKPGPPTYGSVLITGTVGGIGGVVIAVTISNGAIGSIRNLMTGAAWSNTNLTITYGVSNNVGYLTFKTTSSANSNLCIIGG